MQAARRLYLYAMAGVTLAVIAAGLVILIEVLLQRTAFLPEPYGGFVFDSRQQISQAVAMLGVGLPVWAIHWRLIQRGLGADRADRDAEGNSGIRAVYLTLVLLASLMTWVISAANVVKSLAMDVIGGVEDFVFLDPASAVALTIVGLVVWLYHGVVRRGDLRAGPVTGVAAWVPRLYLYAVSLGALVIALTAVNAMLQAALDPPDFGEDLARFTAIDSGVSILAWGLVWFGHWRYAAGLARADDWRGTEERISRTRIAALLATILITSAHTLLGAASVVKAALVPLFPGIDAPGPDMPGDDVRRIVVAGVAVIPWALAWWAHSRALRREPAAAEPLRALHQARLETHVVAAVGLAIGAFGFGWLLGLGIDIVLGGGRATGRFGWFWQDELSMLLPMAVIGLATWAWSWRAVIARARLDPDDEANSTIRRTFLYVTLAGGLVFALAGAAVILYRLVGTLIGAPIGGEAVAELSTPLGALITAVAVLAYHGLLLRADQARKEAAVQVALPGPPVNPGATDPAPQTASERRRLELSAPAGADLDAALAAARAALPQGVRLEEPPA